MKAAYQIGRLLVLLIASIACLDLSLVRAADTESAKDTGPALDIRAQVDELIEVLHTSSFSARQAASQKLESLGAAAFELLASAAIQGDTEVVHRTLEILKRAASQKDVATKNAAKQAINRIATSRENSAS